MQDPVTTQVDVEVRYFETDQMGVVHHVNYLVWFELARTDLCAKAGYPYVDIEKRGYLLMNSELRARYHRPARYGDTVRVTCWIERLASRAIHFAYEVHRDDELLASGVTEHVWIESATTRPCRAPEDIRRAFRELAGFTDRPESEAVDVASRDADAEVRDARSIPEVDRVGKADDA